MNSKTNMHMNMNMNMGGGGGGGEGLARQQSVYSLTLDEFQHSLGKDLGSMNMDELMKTIWTAEETHAVASTNAPPIQPISTAAAGPQRQGSLTLPCTLSQKSVDQVWRNLTSAGTQQPQQSMLGEMTLEEFLVRAGVVRDGQLVGNSTLLGGVNASGFDLKYPQAARSVAGLPPNPVPNYPVAALPINSSGAGPYAAGVNAAGLPNPPGAAGLAAAGGIMGFGDPAAAAAAALTNGFIPSGVGLTGASADLSSDSFGRVNGDVGMVSPPVPYTFGGGLRGRKSAAAEKVVERRHRRMIKNRESAARSRARKQAYMIELEAEVAKLKEQNEELEKKRVCFQFKASSCY
uniref:Abscisic acid responsive elements-binding factor A n=1 Tax=Xerophyta humilis TaxID=211604 RepID=A0A6H0XBG4_9LILI|nr:abscisic acid responsive elements-binding factor A [Xerophyta humilis]